MARPTTRRRSQSKRTSGIGGGEAVALRIVYIGGNAPVLDLPDNKPSRLVFYECKPSAVGRPARNIDSTLPAEEFAQGTWFSPG